MKSLSTIIFILSFSLAGCARPHVSPITDKPELRIPSYQIPSTIDRQFTPEKGMTYHIVGSNIFHSSDPGPAEINTSRAWSVANEFVYRTALAAEYSLPASSTGANGNTYVVKFRNLKTQQYISVEVNIQTRTATLK